MAEHELCKLGVTGSNPVASTSLRDESCEGALVGYGSACHVRQAGV